VELAARIVTQFTAGALACAAVRRLRPTERTRRVAGYLSLLLIVGMVGILYVLDAPSDKRSRGQRRGGRRAVRALVITLAIGVGSLPGLLSTRVLVYGGEISFCLYMVHELVHTPGMAIVQFELTPQDNPWKWNVIGLLVIAVGVSVLLYHVVEEPARQWMRRMVRDKPHVRPSSTSSEPEQVSTKLHQIDGGRKGFRPARCDGFLSPRIVLCPSVNFLVRFPLISMQWRWW